jgi:hypothetical protein
MKHLTENQLKTYFEAWIKHNRLLDTEGEPCPSFESYVAEQEALTQNSSGCLGTNPESQDKLQDLLNQSKEMYEDMEAEEEVAVEAAKPSPNKKEKFTLRDNLGRLIGEAGQYEMTRHEFVSQMKGLFEHVRQSDKYPNTYNAW